MKIGFIFLLIFSIANQSHAYSCSVVMDEFFTLNRGQQAEYVKAVKKAGGFFKNHLKLPEVEKEMPTATSEFLAMFQSGQSKRSSVNSVSVPERKITLDSIKRFDPDSYFAAKERLVGLFVEIATGLSRVPTKLEVAERLKISESEVSSLLFGPGALFKDMTEIYDAAAERYSGKKNNPLARVLSPRIYNEYKLEALHKAFIKRKRFIVTTAAPNTPVHLPFFKSLLTYAKSKDAEIFIFVPSLDTFGLDSILLETPGVHIITNTIKLHPQLTLNNIKVMLSQKNPTAGNEFLGQRGEIQVQTGTKLQLKTVATVDNDENPHFVMSTGGVTINAYSIKHEIQDAQRQRAQQEHIYSAVLLEKDMIENTGKAPVFEDQKGFFHFRQLRYSETLKGFGDINRIYTADRTYSTRVDAINFGDIHSGITDPTFLATLIDLIKTTRPKKIFLHDLLDGRAISHHDEKNLLTQGRKFLEGKLDFMKELREVGAFLNALRMACGDCQLVVADGSNHNQWINRWIDSFKFVESAHNRSLGTTLAAIRNQGENILEYALRELVGIDRPQQLTFIDWDTARRFGIILTMHGDKGANGAKGSDLQFKRAAGKISKDHSHTPAIDGHMTSVGTSTAKRVGYNDDGPSSWVITAELIFDSSDISAGANCWSLGDGWARQLISLTKGQWYSRMKDEKIFSSSEFFFKGYPMVVPNTPQSIGLLVNQHSHRMKGEKPEKKNGLYQEISSPSALGFRPK